MALNPRFPVYIPSKSRADIARTMPCLDRLGVPYWIVVEEQQRDDYARYFDPDRLLVLDPAYQHGYESCDDLGDSLSYGPGPARNFAWDHAISEGHAWHWVMDDNIPRFERFHRNQRLFVVDGTIFHAMETFVLRYRNVAMAGPNYHMFVPSRHKRLPFTVGTRIYSCNLIRNDVPFRWRGRWNEDTILSLDMLKAGWNTVQFNAFLQAKIGTQTMPGGNTEAFYNVVGTKPKSEMLVRQHPDVARLVWKWNRWHHYVDYDQWRDRPLVRRDDAPEEVTYRFRKVPRQPRQRRTPGPRSEHA